MAASTGDFLAHQVAYYSPGRHEGDDTYHADNEWDEELIKSEFWPIDADCILYVNLRGAGWLMN
ncbi:UNVERIFIED_CONTAM: hypothetical protein Sradi_3226400 [Sesamum radiatum]|uniref:Uncharacterized protein n=1 Tax=Sesamum radiatum TaxID=300843 RepID=A0AAW2RGM9_SESRA